MDGQRVPYAEGEGLLWDGTFPHEVLNPGPNPRLALLLDIRRPVTRLRQKIAFRAIMRGGQLYSWINEGRMRAA